MNKNEKTLKELKALNSELAKENAVCCAALDRQHEYVRTLEGANDELLAVANRLDSEIADLKYALSHATQTNAQLNANVAQLTAKLLIFRQRWLARVHELKMEGSGAWGLDLASEASR